MKRVRVDFVDFYKGYSKEDNIFSKALRECCELEISDDPEIIFYSDCGGSENHKHYKNCLKVFVTQENKFPHFRDYDYAFSYLEISDPRNMRLPFYAWRYLGEGLARRAIKKEEEIHTLLEDRPKFCSFVVSNSNLKRTWRRLEFFRKLSRYKKVDSAGLAFNNMGENTKDKEAFLRSYKFNICFENRAYPGYVSEKLHDAMLARSMPIYWGAPDVDQDFNPKSFVNVSDFKNVDEAVDYVVELDKNDDLYLKHFKEPYFYDNAPSKWFDHRRLVPQMERIINGPRRTRSFYNVRDWPFNFKKTLEPYLEGYWLKKKYLKSLR